jgi:uncharacterized membrane protein YidH (DUF202 family)
LCHGADHLHLDRDSHDPRELPDNRMSSEQPGFDRKDTDVTRRTWLAAERTWLAWWRTGIGVAAVAIAIGRFLPGVTGGTQWPYRILGLGYAVLGIANLVIGAARQHSSSRALSRGDYDPLSPPVVMWMTAGAILLAVATMVLVAIGT